MSTRSLLTIIVLLTCFVPSIFALNPSKEYKATPSKLNMKFEEQRVQTEDGASLNTWYFPSSRITNKLVIVSHNGDGNMGDNLNRIKSLISFGFNVLCFDYRGFGASSTFEISDDIYIYSEFYKDFESVYNYAVDNYGKKIYLYGWGIGASISNTIGYTKPNTYSIISDGSIARFSDMPQRFRKIGSRMRIDDKVLSNYKDPISVLGGTPPINFRGILLLVGSHDYLFTKEDLESLNNAIKSDSKESHVFPNSRSWENYQHNPSDYMRMLHQFLVNY